MDSDPDLPLLSDKCLILLCPGFHVFWNRVNYTCLPHGNISRISLYRVLRMPCMAVISFSSNKSKAETKQFPCYNPTLETTTHQQRVTHKHHEPRIWCLLLQVCLHRKNDLRFQVRLAKHAPSTDEREMSESRGVAHGWSATCIASSLFTREQSWVRKWPMADHSKQLQKCHLETTFSELCWGSRIALIDQRRNFQHFMMQSWQQWSGQASWLVCQQGQLPPWAAAVGQALFLGMAAGERAAVRCSGWGKVPDHCSSLVSLQRWCVHLGFH